MTIYIVCYAFVYLLLYKIDNVKNNKSVKALRIILAILVLSFLACCRDITVGSDTRGYAYNTYIKAKNSNIAQWTRYVNKSYIEPGYLYMVYFSAKIFGSFSGVLFVTALIINGGVIIGLYRVRQHISFDIGVLVYCFLFFQYTLNGMRQWLAIAVIIFGIKYLYEKNALKFGITIAVAVLFHMTAIVAVTLYILMLIVPNEGKILRRVMIVFAMIVFILSYQSVMDLLINNGFIDSRFEYYVEGNTVSFAFTETIIRIPTILLCIVYYKNMKIEGNHHEYWFLILIVDLILSQLYSVMVFASRLAMYFTIARIFELSIACKLKVRESKIIRLMVILYIVALWYVDYIYLNHGLTYPYTSQILGIG